MRCIRRALRVLFAVSLALLLPWGAHGMAVISEVLWAGSDLSTADEWLELTCVHGEAETCPADVSGWSVRSVDSGGTEVPVLTFGSGTTIGEGEWALLGNYDEPQSRLAVIPRFVTTAVSLLNTNLLLRLYDGSGMLRDEVDDGTGAPFAGTTGDVKASMERIDLSQPGSLAENWRTATDSRGYDPDSPMLGTPGFQNAPTESSSSSSAPSSSSESSESSESSDSSASSSSSLSSVSSFPSNILITEVLADPLGLDTNQWIEIGNLGSDPANIDGLVLAVGDQVSGFAIPPRSGSGFILVPGEHAALRRTLTRLPLPHSGGRVKILSGSNLLDDWTYPKTAEDVSYGRSAADRELFGAFCVPTEGARNELLPIEAELQIQSGETRGVGSVSVNLQAVIRRGPIASTACTVDFGDGTVSQSCNPPSHAFPEPGTYTVLLEARSFCGDLVTRALDVEVLEPSATQSSSASSARSASSRRSSPGASSSSAPACSPQPPGGVSISEFLPNPEGVDAAGEWIELQNLTRAPVSLCGWSLDDDEGGSKPFVLDGVEIPAGGFVLLKHKETGLALQNDTDSVRLLRGADVFEDIPYAGVRSGESLARFSGERFLWTRKRTPGKPNPFPSADASGRVAADVLRVIDGDTIEVAFADGPTATANVRLLGVDAPELESRQRKEREAAERSAAFVRRLLEGVRVALSFDREYEDAYGRLLAEVFLPDGTLLQHALLAEGLARVERAFTFSAKEEFLALEREAEPRVTTLAADRAPARPAARARKSSPRSAGLTDLSLAASALSGSIIDLRELSRAGAAPGEGAPSAAAAVSLVLSLLGNLALGALFLARRWRLL